MRDDPPANRRDTYFFPYPEQVLNRAIVDREAIAFARRWLGTDRIQYRPGLGLVTYPGFRGNGDRAHIDNGNNSLLPPTLEDRGHSQIIFWFYLEDVDEDQAPTRFLATADGQDMRRAVPMVAPGGSVGIFHNYTWHAATDYTRPSGQRYVWKFAFGRADHYWEGTAHYTQVGEDPHFRAFIGGLGSRDRELFRFSAGRGIPITRRRRCGRWRNSTRAGTGPANTRPPDARSDRHRGRDRESGGCHRHPAGDRQRHRHADRGPRQHGIAGHGVAGSLRRVEGADDAGERRHPQAPGAQPGA